MIYPKIIWIDHHIRGEKDETELHWVAIKHIAKFC